MILYLSRLQRAQSESYIGFLHIEEESLDDIGFKKRPFVMTKFLIDHAVMSHNSDLVGLLLDKGLYNLPDSPSMTPVHWLATQENCAMNDLRNILGMQVQAGYNINGFNQDGFTPLHLACFNCKSVCLPVQLASFKDVDFNPDWLRNCMFCRAPEKLISVKLLIEMGADINSLSTCGVTPLFVSCLLPKPALTEYLLQAGALVNIKAQHTVLILLEHLPFSGSLETLKVLLVYSIDMTEIQENMLMRGLNMLPLQDSTSLIALLLALGHKLIYPDFLVQQPLGLERICANRIRKCLSPELYTNLMELGELPPCIKEYIMMKQLNMQSKVNDKF